MNRSPRVVLLAGGVGGSTFAVGLRDEVRERGGELTVVCNTGDDLWLAGVRLQPDVDSMLYALADVKDTTKGWGRRGDSTRLAGELHAWGVGWDWFELGDLDLGAHLARTSWLREGASVSEALRRLQSRWDIGATLLPMTDAELDTRVVTAERTMHFQEWWTRFRASILPERFDNPGIETAVPAPGVLDALAQADAIVVAPSNPVVSIDPILAVPGVRGALRAASARVVGVSPIIGGAPVRGMADICLRVVGVTCSAAGVAAHYGARESGGILDGWMIAEEDAADRAGIEALGVTTTVAPLWMTDAAHTRAMAVRALAAAGLPG